MEILIKMNPENPQEVNALKELSDKLCGEKTSIVDIPINPAAGDGESICETAKQKTTAKEAKAEMPKADAPTDIETTIEDVRKGLIELKDAKGAEAAKAILAEFAASKTTDLTEDKYAEVVARIVEELI